MKRLTLFRTVIRTFFIQSLWNYESLLAYGVAFTVLPVLQKLYSPREIIRKGREYLSYFNTQPYLSAFILGIVVKLEEVASKEKTSYANKISSVKAGLMGPMAALGDSFFWWCLRPTGIILTVFLVLFFYSFDFSIYFLAFFLVFYNFFHLFYRFGSFFYGYRYGEEGLSFFYMINLNVLQKILFRITLFISGVTVVMLVLNFPFERITGNLNRLTNLNFQIFYSLAIVVLFFIYRIKNSPLLLLIITLIFVMVYAFLNQHNVLMNGIS